MVGEVDEFLRPLRVDPGLLHKLSREFVSNFTHLAAKSTNQFLPTPISEPVLRPAGRKDDGR